jgi:hypothetical protein
MRREGEGVGCVRLCERVRERRPFRGGGGGGGGLPPQLMPFVIIIIFFIIVNNYKIINTGSAANRGLNRRMTAQTRGPAKSLAVSVFAGFLLPL